MNRTTMRGTLTLSLLAAVLAPDLALAQGAAISTIPSGPRNRRLEIVIAEPSQAPIVTPAEPDKGPLPEAIVGTMISGGKRFAVTENRLLAEGDVVGTFRITEITLDRVACTSGATKRVLDMRSGNWSTGEPVAQAE